jgi:hypothetical protein
MQVDVALGEVADAGHPEQGGGVKDVGADDLRDREGVHHDHHEAEERPAPNRGQPDDEAEGRADCHGDDPVAILEDERRVARLHPAFDERLEHQPHRSQNERSADRVGLRRLHTLAVGILEPAGRPDPQ